LALRAVVHSTIVSGIVALDVEDTDHHIFEPRFGIEHQVSESLRVRIGLGHGALSLARSINVGLRAVVYGSRQCELNVNTEHSYADPWCRSVCMSQETRTETTTAGRMGLADWQAGVVGGLVGGAAMGAMITTMMPPVIEGAIPALYGLSGGLAGWIVHMIHSAIFGVVFAAIAGTTSIGNGLGRSAVAGVVYGIVLWAVLAALVMPIW